MNAVRPIPDRAADPPKPLVSVIMPCYDAAPYLEQAVTSALDQTWGRVELVLVDDGSTDGSPEIAARLAERYGARLIRLATRHEGPYPARNAGLARASGEFVAFLDADDYWSPDFVAKLHAALAGSDAALAYCGWQNVGAARNADPYVPPDYEREGKLELFLRSAAPWPIHAALVRRSAIDEVGGFDTNFATCMDYDLWLRIGAARRVVRVPEVLAYYRHHDRGQITSKQWRQAENVWLVKRKFVRSAPRLVERFTPQRLSELIDGGLLRRGYDCYWRRDLVSARRIFRRALTTRGWTWKDLRYLLPALLPEGPYVRLVTRVDRRAAG